VFSFAASLEWFFETHTYDKAKGVPLEKSFSNQDVFCGRFFSGVK